jgi:chorismate mutase / prephenate dehydratase
MASADNPLDDLRRQIDGIDDALHDLLIRRAEIAERIGRLKSESAGATPVVFLRPGREAIVLRRLVARHKGALPKAALVRLWRELVSALLRLQGPFAVAVQGASHGPGCWELARDHFGGLTPITAHESGWQVLRAVVDGEAQVGVLPLPQPDVADPWWRHLLNRDPKIPRIVARLPFAEPAGRSGVGEAFAVARAPQEPTGKDRSIIAIETAPQTSGSGLTAALKAAGLEPTASQVWRDPKPGNGWLHFVELDGFLSADEPRLAALVKAGEPVRQLWSLGGYAVPFAAAELAGEKA